MLRSTLFLEPKRFLISATSSSLSFSTFPHSSVPSSSPLRYAFMERAALLPAAMARITSAGPDTTSPPANTPSILVLKVAGSTSSVPRSVNVNPSGSALLSTLCPIAIITLSTSIVNSEPWTSLGRRRPLASGSPISIRAHFIPVTRLSFDSTSTGTARN